MSFHLPHEMFQNQTALLADLQDFEQKNSGACGSDSFRPNQI
ncbi:hypothetical protein NT05HA_1009 [Aggregatibacter aphrophilus NJ8700]|nr:hypothetical protein NT05HA_1009 [Aggregatibacter aphrophilus NJ8700]